MQLAALLAVGFALLFFNDVSPAAVLGVGVFLWIYLQGNKKKKHRGA